MAKSFFEVFPTLKLDKGLESLMEQAKVERISSTKAKDFLRIYLESDRLIPKESVFVVEKEIKKQLFPGANITIKIYEKFHLSVQYNAEKLFDVYKESILLEVREYSHLMHNIVKGAEFSFEDKKITVTFDDTVLAHSKSEELLGIFDKIFNDRCGMNVQISVAYKEVEGDRFKEENERKLAMQVAQISARVRSLKGESGDEDFAGVPEVAESAGENLAGGLAEGTVAGITSIGESQEAVAGGASAGSSNGSNKTAAKQDAGAKKEFVRDRKSVV